MKWLELKSDNRKVAFTATLITGILILVYIVCQFLYTTLDATEERRYTLTPATKKLVKSLDDRVYIKVLLDGKFPAGFKRLRESTADILRQFAQVSSQIEYDFENPNAGSVDEINDRRKDLGKKGIIPTQLRVNEGTVASTQYIYPYAIMHFGSRSIVVNLLQDDIPGADKDLILNNSIALLEYKIADGIQKLKQFAPATVAFSTGQGELTDRQTGSLEKDLRTAHDVRRINLDSVIVIPSVVKVLIIAKPIEHFTEGQLFMLDQYIMHGGKVIFLLDPLTVSIDSVNKNKFYIPFINDLGLDPLLFKLGARVNPNLVLDLQCTKIPMVVGMQGDKPQTELFPWYYHVLVSSTSNHPITKGLDRIQLEFPSTVDTIHTATQVRKTMLLESSQNARTQLTPVRLSFDILKEQPDLALFNKSHLGLALMLEGTFQSMFANRLSEKQLATLKEAGVEFKAEGDSAKVLIVTDGDIAKNLVNASTGEIAPLGFNKYENSTYTGNRDFLLNAVEYMLDDRGVLEARTKDIKLRLLNVAKAKEEGMKWQLINILGPLGLILVLGILYQYIRKRKYGRAA
ncbi:MAG TPA: gliding motility-associated ABC transporter substrate-binding protein GldG [Saprospiraceae bacterium]|nr:gliding motility-associated ABC transporter substrate-binding protein GldG [Saprospiraceae bacterium]